MNRPVSPFRLIPACAASRRKVCDCTFLAAALVRQADASLVSSFASDTSVSHALYALAGDAMYAAAGASKSEEAAHLHRQEGDKYYALAQRYSPALLKEDA